MNCIARAGAALAAGLIVITAVAECGGKVLCRKKAMIFTPGEMALITLNPDDLRNLPSETISVRIVRS